MNILIKRVNKLFPKYWHGLILVALAICFFIGTSSYNYITQDDGFIKWASPDETANYVFSKLYGQTGEIVIFEKYNLRVDDIIHPRSLRSDLGYLKPVSFLGIILIYGKIISLTSYKILPFLTPLFASIGIIFFYLLVKKIFGPRNALISSFLLASFPPFIYYSARSMFHNVLFVILLIIGLYYSVLMIKKYKTLKIFKRLRESVWLNWLYSALAGSFIGLAIITRTSELLWLAPVFIIIWLSNIKKIGLTKLIIFLSFLFLSLMPVMYQNQILYDSPTRGGYPEMNKAIVDITNAGGDLVKSTIVGKFSYHKELLEKISGSIFHFGFNPEQSLKMLYYYFVRMFPWIFWPAILGLFLFLQRASKWKKKHLVYFLSLTITSLALIFYYGSWEFHDNPNPASFTIGNSYTRYWLPIYLGALPFVSMFIIRSTRLLFSRYNANPLIANNGANDEYASKPKNIGNWLAGNIEWPRRKFLINSSRIVLIAIIYFFSFSFILYGSEEGLIYTAQNQQAAKREYDRVLNLTEGSAVIITRYHDKLFFPERKVIVGLFDDYNMNLNYAKLVGRLPVYYYNFTFPPKDIDYLNKRKLAEVGLRIEKVKQITSDFTLYQLKKVESIKLEAETHNNASVLIK